MSESFKASDADAAMAAMFGDAVKESKKPAPAVSAADAAMAAMMGGSSDKGKISDADAAMAAMMGGAGAAEEKISDADAAMAAMMEGAGGSEKKLSDADAAMAAMMGGADSAKPKVSDADAAMAAMMEGVATSPASAAPATSPAPAAVPTEDKPLLTLEDAKELVMLLEAGMQQEADKKLLAITKKHEESFYQQVGYLTRDLHTAVQKFAYDPRLREITDEEIPNASERLRYIITVTDKAATRTLDAVDKCTPIALALKSSIDDLMPIWKHLMNGRIDRFEFVFLCHRIDDLLKKTAEDASDLSNQLNEILMAQDFQDLTGQMIQRVVGLITEVEDKLLEFLRFFGQYTPVQDQERLKQKAIEAQGPALDSQIEANAAAASQDEVDDLLASLGF